MDNLFNLVGSALDGLQKSEQGPRRPKKASLTNSLAGIVGFVVGVGVGLLVLWIEATVSGVAASFAAIAVPLGGCAIASVLVVRRSRSPVIRHAAGGLAFACVAQLLLYAGAG